MFVGDNFRKSIKKDDPCELILLARNNAARKHKVRLRVHHLSPLMAANRQIVKETILFMPH